MSEYFQILSLDGGGIKGIFSAAMLAHIEEDLNIKITNHFDLIVGTSTGGIIALGLGVGMLPKEIVDFYVSYGPKIFNSRLSFGIKRLFRNKYNSDVLEGALQECFGDKLLMDSDKRVVVPSYNLTRDDIYIFKTPHNKRLTRDLKVPIWKVAMATCAAPTYFPIFRNLNYMRLIDGGIWANNPTMVGIIEAISLLNISVEKIRVLSIGTTLDIDKRPRYLNKGGILQWGTKGAFNIVLDAQSIGVNTQSEHLIGKERFFRINPKVPAGLFKIDKIANEELLATAAHESRIFSPTFKENFMNHIAEKPEFFIE